MQCCPIMVALQSSDKLDDILKTSRRLIDQWKYKYCKGALVVDIDDTIFYQQGESTQVFKAMKEFLLYAKSKKIEIFFVTARTTAIKEETMHYLKEHEIPHKKEKVFFMKPGTNTDFVRISEWKYNKRSEISKTHEIIMSIGDMWTDLIRIDKEGDIEGYDTKMKKILKNSYPYILVSFVGEPSLWGLKVKRSS